MNNLSQSSRRNWSNILRDIFKTFIGVLLAFWVSEWTANRDFKAKERFLLQQIGHELDLNIKDLQLNLKGHEMGMNAATTFREMLEDPNANLDTLPVVFVHLLRDFTSIQHTAAYETMKARGVESISNDSLRLQIADLYDFDFESVEKIEEQYSPHEFFVNYNQPMLQIISKCYDFTGKKEKRIMPLTALLTHEKNMMYAWLSKLTMDRRFSIREYEEAIKHCEKVAATIQQELERH